MIAAVRRWWSRRTWDLATLLSAADARASRPERHLWLARLVEWLRSDPPAAERRFSTMGLRPDETDFGGDTSDTPWPVRRLRHVLGVLERNPAQAAQVRALIRTVLTGTDVAALLADFGFAPRASFASELVERLRLACLPGTPDTNDLGELFQLVFHHHGDPAWLTQVDAVSWRRVARLLVDEELSAHWRGAVLDSIQLLASQVRAVGMGATLRKRMDEALLVQRPFHHLAQVAQHLADLDALGDLAGVQAQAQALRAQLLLCRQAVGSVRGHLDAWGVSVDVVFQVDQLRERTERISALLTLLTSPQPERDWPQLIARLAEGVHSRRNLRSLFGHHYSMLARKVTERSAATGEHYITRSRAEYIEMLRSAAGGGAVVAGTTFMKFGIAALALSAFWGGFWAGISYAASFVLIHLLHWTLATKQPAMTAPAMAAKLEGVHLEPAAIEGFVDEVTHLIRSQMAGIVGNLLVVAPVVLAAQGLSWWWHGAPLIGVDSAHHVLDSLTLLGPTAAFAAFTGVLLFASSLIAGWVENGFVLHRLDSAIAWNPHFVRLLGSERAMRWSIWWRANISGLAANVSLGLLLGLVPALATFFGLPIEVRHVTLGTGQIAAALGTLGPSVLRDSAFWWCVAAIPVTGALNLLVSFVLAFRVALRSRSLLLRERGRLYAALRERLRTQPRSFLMPPREVAAAPDPAP
ncbi:MAG: site-specific recombinase [Leptothrix sp. (in: b-proteobacteria)]